MTTRRPRLTAKALDAMIDALNSALAGDVGEGDFEGVSGDDLQRALDWCFAERERREKRASLAVVRRCTECGRRSGHAAMCSRVVDRG